MLLWNVRVVLVDQMQHLCEVVHGVSRDQEPKVASLILLKPNDRLAKLFLQPDVVRW